MVFNCANEAALRNLLAFALRFLRFLCQAGSATLPLLETCLTCPVSANLPSSGNLPMIALFLKPACSGNLPGIALFLKLDYSGHLPRIAQFLTVSSVVVAESVTSLLLVSAQLHGHTESLVARSGAGTSRRFRAYGESRSSIRLPCMQRLRLCPLSTPYL